MRGRTAIQEYALYKGDTFLCMGKIKDIAKAMNVKEKTVYWWGTPSARIRGKQNKLKKEPNRKMLVKIEEE